MNEIEEKQSALAKEYEERNPNSFARKKLILYLLSAMVGARLLHTILDASYLLIYNVPVSPFVYFTMFLSMIVAIVYAFLIYKKGVVIVAYLAALGGLGSFLTAYINDTLLSLSPYDGFYNTVAIIFFGSILIQTFAMLFISIDKKCRLYLNTMAEISRDLKARM